MNDLSWNEYVPLAIKTAKPLSHTEQIEHALLGMITEMGEVAEIVKKTEIYGKELDINHLKEEIADEAWYLALYCNEERLKLERLNSQIYRTFSNKQLIFEMTKLVACLISPGVNVSKQSVCEYVYAVLNELATRHNLTMGQALDANIRKLAARYGDKFSEYLALNRDLDNEAKVLST